MTAPMFANRDLAHYNRLKARFSKRDRIHQTIHQIRQGNIRQLFPNELNFSLTFEGSPIANFVDIVARDMAEGIAPLPALACVSGKMKTDADLRRAEIKNRIGDNFWRHSKLDIQMLKAADRYVTYGFLPVFMEPDTGAQLPFMHLEDPRNAYYELDRYGRCKVYAKRWLRSIDDLCAAYPEFEKQIRLNPTTGKQEPNGDTELELIRWVDGTSVSLWLPSRDGLVLGSYDHLCSRTPVWIAERPGEDDAPRGQFDDVIWVQVARSIMSTLALEAASIAVQAPIAVPSDMDQFSVGPHALLQSDEAQSIHKVNLELPPQIFAEGQALDQELRVGSRYPEARSGGIQASVITGKGVEALLGTFDAQIKGAQLVFKEALQQATAIAFEMDEKWWPNLTKTVGGTLSGTSYEFDYTPAKDIGGRYHCTVTYGFAAGLNPSQSIVTMLQLEGAGLIAKGTTQENLPFGVDQIQEQKKIHVEQAREAMKQGLFAVVQSSGQMAAQGQDPMPTILLAVETIKALEDGKSVEDAISDAYEKQKAEQAAKAAEQQTQGQGGPAPSGGGEGMGAEQGLPFGVAPGQAGLPPGGRPTLEQMIAGFRGNAALPVNQLEIRRSQPTGQ